MDEAKEETLTSSNTNDHRDDNEASPQVAKSDGASFQNVTKITSLGFAMNSTTYRYRT